MFPNIYENKLKKLHFSEKEFTSQLTNAKIPYGGRGTDPSYVPFMFKVFLSYVILT